MWTCIGINYAASMRAADFLLVSRFVGDLALPVAEKAALITGDRLVFAVGLAAIAGHGALDTAGEYIPPLGPGCTRK
jgi:hypothetical protein